MTSEAKSRPSRCYACRPTSLENIVDELDFRDDGDISGVLLLLSRFLRPAKLIESRRFMNGRLGVLVLVHERRVFSFFSIIAGSVPPESCRNRINGFAGEALSEEEADERE